MFFPNNILCWDVFGYYLYLPLKFIYHDLGLLNDSILETINNKYHNTATFYQVLQFPDGHYVMKYSMGLAILYLPFFFIGHLIALLFHFPVDGFSAPYQYSIFIGGIIYSIIGIIFLTKVLRCFFKDIVVFFVVLIIVIGTNYIVHITMYGQNANSHNYLFTAYVLILWYTIKWHETFKTKYIILLALICGITILSRPSEIVCLLIPLFWHITDFKSFKAKFQLLIKKKTHILLFGLIVISIGSFQLIYWKVFTGKFLYYSYCGNAGEGFEFFSPYIYQVLLGFRKGWLIYTPVMLFALIGFYFLYLKNREIFVVLIIYTICNIYIVSSWSCWWYAQCFSQRALIPSYPVMAILLGYYISWLNERKLIIKFVGYLLFFMAIVLNIFQTIQFNYGIIDGDRMTRPYYFATFGKLNISDKEKELLLINRSFDGGEKFTNEKEYNLVLQKELNFENFKNATSSFAFSGKYSFKIDDSIIYSPTIEIPYSKLTTKDHAWIRVSANIYPTSDSKKNPFSMVVHFTNKGWAYKYRSYDSEKYNLMSNKWNKIQFEYLTPEVRRKSNPLKVYLWNRSKMPIYIDNLNISVFEKKD
jgi:hypothetical protein